MPRPNVITALTTPFHANGSLDLPGFRRAVRHVMEGGVDAMLVNGTTGEFPSLTAGERKLLLEEALGLAGPESVIAHIGASSAYEAVQLVESALTLGCTTIAAITPYFLPASSEAVRCYFGAIRDAAPDMELYAYLFPARTHVEVSVAETAQLVTELGLAGVKLSIPDVEFLRQLAPLVGPDVRLYSGNDRLVVEVDSAGGCGVVSGVSSAVPEIVTEIARRLPGGASNMTAAQARLDHAVDLLGPSIGSLKTALMIQGVINSDRCRMAIDPIDATHRQQIAQLIERDLAGARRDRKSLP